MGGEPGHSILMDPHSSHSDLIRKRRHHAMKLTEAGFSDAGRNIPIARLVAIDEMGQKASEVAKRAAQWTVAACVGRAQNDVPQDTRTFGGKDPIDFYLEDVIIYGTADSVSDQVLSFGAEIGMK